MIFGTPQPGGERHRMLEGRSMDLVEACVVTECEGERRVSDEIDLPPGTSMSFRIEVAGDNLLLLHALTKHCRTSPTYALEIAVNIAARVLGLDPHAGLPPVAENFCAMASAAVDGPILGSYMRDKAWEERVREVRQEFAQHYDEEGRWRR